MRATRLPGLALFLLACGAESVAPAAPAEAPENASDRLEEAVEEAESTPEIETAYAIHEWGFIAHHYAHGANDGASELLTSGTAPAPAYAPTVQLPGQLPGHHSNGRSGGKPVIYVHLQGDGNIARFTASLSTSGRFLEEWPHSEGSTPTSLSWDVEARRGSCSARNNYPTAGGLHCLGIADRYCEAAELAHYETEDSACLTVDGKEWNHLFYRAQIAGDVPLRVSKRGDTFTVHNARALPGRLMRIRRGDNASETRVALFDAPVAGESSTLPATLDRPAAVGIAALEAELGALGMSEDEVGAFMIAWQAELFGDTEERQQVEMVGSPPHDLRPKDDVLIYFLPTATLDAMVPLTLSPPPTEVRRAVLVRIDLGEAPPREQGAIRTGNLGTFEALRANGQGGSGPAIDRAIDRAVFRLGQLAVEGGLERGVIQRVIRRHSRQLRDCGEHLPAGMNIDSGFQLVIRAAGTVESANFNDVPAELATCVQSAAEDWAFPVSEHGSTQVVARFLFDFR